MLQNCSVWCVASVFFREPTKRHYLKQISRQIHLAHTSVKREINKLLKQEIILEEHERRGTRDFPHYCANLDSAEYKHYKKLYNVHSLKGIVEHLEEHIMPQAIILFGSYQRGEDIESSDVDIYIQSDEVEINISRFEKELGREVQLFFRKNFGSYPDELQESIRNGTTLRGYLENKYPTNGRKKQRTQKNGR